MEIEVYPGFNPDLYWAFINLYKPCISRSHLTDKLQYFIYYKQELSGCLSINDKNYVQIMVAPWCKGCNIPYRVLTQSLAPYFRKVHRVGWIAYFKNYPTLKLLHSLGGSLLEKELVPGVLEGYYLPNKLIDDPEARTRLETYLVQAKLEYKEWVDNTYCKRKDEVRKLKTILRGYTI